MWTSDVSFTLGVCPRGTYCQAQGLGHSGLELFSSKAANGRCSGLPGQTPPAICMPFMAQSLRLWAGRWPGLGWTGGDPGPFPEGTLMELVLSLGLVQTIPGSTALEASGPGPCHLIPSTPQESLQNLPGLCTLGDSETLLDCPLPAVAPCGLCVCPRGH